jgi:3-hydroxybutyryl-CoA dehydratase
MTSMRMKSAKGIAVGDRFRVVRTFTEQDIVGFAAASKDYNPVHFDDRFAAAKKFKGRICHGLLVGGMLTQIGGQLGLLAKEIHFQFKKPVFVGDTIACQMTITKMTVRGAVEGDVVFTNSDGVVVILAEVKGNLPGDAEREIIRQMVEEGDPTNLAAGESEA